MKYITKALFLLVLLFVNACGGGSSSSNACSPLNAKHSKVFGGESCNQEARSPVVALVAVASNGERLFGFGFCTGSLVTLDDLITSAHCFVGPIVQARDAGITLAGFVALVGGENGEVLEIVNAAIHPSYDGQVGSRYDVAMATISKVPTPAIGPLPILLSELTLPGSEINAFGYGTNNDGEVGELKASKFTISSLSNGNLIVVGDGKSSICSGDSGGPAIYVTSGGVATLAGVNSFGFGACVPNALRAFGFVDLQFDDVLNFIVDYAPDVAAG